MKYKILTFVLVFSAFIISDSALALRPGETSTSSQLTVVAVDQNGTTVPDFEYNVILGNRSDIDQNQSGAPTFTILNSETSIGVRSFNAPDGYNLESLIFSGTSSTSIDDCIARPKRYNAEDRLPIEFDREDFVDCTDIEAKFIFTRNVSFEVYSNEPGIEFNICGLASSVCETYTTSDDLQTILYDDSDRYILSINQETASQYELFTDIAGRSMSNPTAITVINLNNPSQTTVNINRYDQENFTSLEAYRFGQVPNGYPQSLDPTQAVSDNQVLVEAGTQVSLVWNSIGYGSCEGSWEPGQPIGTLGIATVLPTETTTYQVTCN